MKNADKELGDGTWGHSHDRYMGREVTVRLGQSSIWLSLVPPVYQVVNNKPCPAFIRGLL